MDKISKEKRSLLMSKIKSKNTKIEISFFDDLKDLKIKHFAFQKKGIYGKPDIVHEYCKIAIFIDSCFWHGCKKHIRMPSQNLEYWKEKICNNRKRDKKVTKLLMKDGWKVIRIWEHSLMNLKAKKQKLDRIKKEISDCYKAKNRK